MESTPVNLSPTTLVRTLGAALLALPALAACSTPGDPHMATGATRVLLHDYLGGQRFELVSESHTDRVQYYSSPRTDATRKVQLDQVMDALIAELDDLGFSEYRKSGPAPSRGGSVVTRGIEIQRPTGVEHWIVGSGSAPEERLEFNECLSTFMQLYNITQSYQAIENAGGAEVFDESVGARGRT